MKTRIAALGVILCLHLLGSTEVQGQSTSSATFTERLAGCAESVDGVLYVMSGMSLSANLAEVGSYDPSTKTWTAKAAIPTPRAGGASGCFENSVCVIGGRSGNAILSTVERYIPAQDKWITRSPMPTARWDLMACTAGGKIYAFGGISGTGTNRRALDIIEAYNPQSDTWESMGKMPEKRHGAAIATVNGIIYVISGKTASYVESTASSITRRVDSFDPNTKTWTRLQDIPTGRGGARAVVANGLIFVVGGVTKGGDYPTEVDVFDPRSNQWSAGPRLSSGRSGHMGALVGDSIILFGGSSVSYGSGKMSISGSMETIPLSGYQQK